MQAATESKLNYFLIVGFLLVFSGPIMAVLIVMLVGTIIAMVFFILAMIVAVAAIS